MSKTSYYEYDGTSMYAQVFERNRDMGSEMYPLDSVDGQYKIQLVVDKKTRDKMVKDGVPESAMGYDMFKPVEGEDDKFAYTFKRTHLHKNFKDDSGIHNCKVHPTSLIGMLQCSSNKLCRGTQNRTFGMVLKYVSSVLYIKVVLTS